MMKREAIYILSALLIAITMLIQACGPAQYTLSTSITPVGAGTVTPADGTYDDGTNVTLIANPASGYAFDYWSGDVAGAAGSTTITMDSGKGVIAHFKKQYKLTTSVTSSDSGIVNPSGGVYDAYSTVNLHAVPSLGYTFDHWSGDATGTSEQGSVYMDNDKNVVANYKMFFSQTLSPVCKGTGVPNAAAYEGSKHPVVILGTDGKEHDWSDELPMEWLPTMLEDLQLVLCIGKEMESAVQTCSYNAQAPFDKVTRYQYSLTIYLRAAKTGKLITSTTLRGSAPRACSQTENYYLTRLEGSHISISEVKEWLQKYIGVVSLPAVPATPTVSQAPAPITTAVLPSTQPAAAATSFKSTTYNNDKYGFSIQYPSDWVDRPDLVGQSTYILAEFTVPNFIPGVVVSAFPADAPVTKEWIVKAHTLLKSQDPKVVSDIKEGTLTDGTKCYTYKIHYVSTTGYDIDAYCLDAARGSNRIHVWVFTIEAFMPYNETLFSEIVNTLRFGK